MRELYLAAADAGIIVVEGDLPGREAARYYKTNRCIVLQSGLPRVFGRMALSHELGHVHYAHCCTGDPDADLAQEREADEYAAHLLISPDAYRAAEMACDSHPIAIAHCLEVGPRLVYAWQRIQERKRTQ